MNEVKYDKESMFVMCKGDIAFFFNRSNNRLISCRKSLTNSLPWYPFRSIRRKALN